MRPLEACLILALVAGHFSLSAQSPPEKASPGRKGAQPSKNVIHTNDDFTPYWLEEDVRWIISDEELAAYKTLKNDEERHVFAEQFWRRHDPTPDTFANEFQDEHYQRMVYANEQFASAIPGWKTDRGRIYIKYGPPDQIESHPTGNPYTRPLDEGGGDGSSYPFEVWRYRYLEGVGQEVEIEFVDVCRCNDYRMTIDRSQKDALLHIPQHDRSQPKKAQREVFLYVGAQRPPLPKFKELWELLTVKMQFSQIPYTVHADFLKITEQTNWVRFTVAVKNDGLAWVSKLGKSRIDLALMGQVTNMTGRIVLIFEDPISYSVPEDSAPAKKTGSQLYSRALALPPGRYRVELVLKDRNSGAIGTYGTGLYVPSYPDGALATSSLILADEMTAPKSVVDNFVIGSTRVRPRVEASRGERPIFDRSEALNVWMQVYGLSPDEKSSKPNATIEYQLVNSCTRKVEMHLVEATEHMPILGQQMTLRKSVALARLEPGDYELRIRVSNQNGRQTAQSTAALTVR